MLIVAVTNFRDLNLGLGIPIVVNHHATTVLVAVSVPTITSPDDLDDFFGNFKTSAIYGLYAVCAVYINDWMHLPSVPLLFPSFPS